MRSEKPILLGIPATDMVHTQFMVSVGMLLARSVAVDNLWVGLSCVQGSILESNRDHIVEQALQCDASHLLFLDSDMQFPADILVGLLSHQRDIVAASYCMRRQPRTWVHRLPGGSSRMPDGDALFEAESVGLGCCLIRTDVFRTIIGYEEPNGDAPLFHVERGGRITKEVSEDVYFFRKARAAGFKVWIDPIASRAVRHVGAYGYSESDVEYIRERDQA